MKIIIPGKPIAKQANKISTNINVIKKLIQQDRIKEAIKACNNFFIRQYSSQSKDEKRYHQIISEQCQSHKPYAGALRVDYEFISARPKSHFGTGKNSHILKKSAPVHWIVKRNDFDNMLKFVNDRCSSLIWVDDCQIITGKFDKRYCLHKEEPKTILYISQI